LGFLEKKGVKCFVAALEPAETGFIAFLKVYLERGGGEVAGDAGCTAAGVCPCPFIPRCGWVWLTAGWGRNFPLLLPI